MKTSESWKTWLPILGLLIIFAVISAVWPALADAFSLPSLSFGGGSSTSVPIEPEPIHLEAIKSSLAASEMTSGIADSLPDEISPFLGLAVVAGVVIGGIVVVGGGLAFITRMLANIRTNTMETEAYQEHQNALTQRNKEQMKQMRDGRTTDPTPSHKMPRWSVISNTLIALMFVGFATMVYVRNFFPEGFTEIDGKIVNVTPPVFLVMALITLVIIGFRLRPQKIDAIDETDSGRIPWDFIAVLITGLIMLGLGIGFMAFLNTPA
ncbi:MAG: hypothetical protein DHS20C20_05840 [Ardenticatenaceae bacterium]|nr:MAG: hypothetical protein DHS20C20_05840 [Ardenticatenaceae bacterium]